NKEALPLIGALIVPSALVVAVLLYYFGYDITLVLRKIDSIYYAVMVPIALGLLIAIMYRNKE
ncbi:MAG: hypothetical protein JW771_03795, partial [Candidatus Thermoplasmatota archaeon]|nr:hypothetical protein [Candidatus Thermoplasmatota archaeon]